MGPGIIIIIAGDGFTVVALSRGLDPTNENYLVKN